MSLTASRLLLVGLARARVVSSHALPSTTLLLIAAAVATTILFVPGAQCLSAKGEIFIFDDGWLNPGVG